MSPIKVYGIPYGDKLSASTRLRYLKVLGAMEGIEVTPSLREADLVYIQKRASQETIGTALDAKGLGKAVVYDIDDALGQCASEELEMQMLSYADMITVDTWMKRRLLTGIQGVSLRDKVRIVPDCIDYFDDPPEFTVRGQMKNVVTFGREHSVRAALPYMMLLSDIFFEASFLYSCEEKLVDHPRIDFIKWDLDTFPNFLLNADLAVICHQEDFRGTLRSNNRLLACMAAGLPAVVMDGAANAETLSDMGLPNLLFRGYNVRDRVRWFALQKPRMQISGLFQKYAWKNYAPKVIAANLRAVFEETLNAR